MLTEIFNADYSIEKLLDSKQGATLKYVSDFCHMYSEKGIANT